MKSVLSISLLLLFAYVQMFNGMIWMSYEINKTEIVKQFCENKEKPEMKCEGTCHMKKMMLTDEAEEEGKPMMVLPEIQLYFSEMTVDLLSHDRDIKEVTFYTNLYSFEFLNDWEIPPKA